MNRSPDGYGMAVLDNAIITAKPSLTPRVGETLGVEEEFHLVSLDDGKPMPGSERLLAALPADADVSLIQQEFQRSMIETATPVCTDLAGLREAMVRSRRALIEAGDRAGLGVAAVGSVPDCGMRRGAVYPDARYRRISDEYRHLAVEQQVCAAQVQVGVPDPELAVRCIARIRGWMPALLAMTSGSPFFQQTDTGYSSYRNIVVSRWPTGGPPPAFVDLDDYQRRLGRLIEAGVIADSGMIYYDLRPSHRYPTLEFRIADACPLIDDVVLLAALARALVVTAAAEVWRGDPAPQVAEETLRGATWKAARSGLAGQLVDPIAGQPVRAPELLRRLLAHVRDALQETGDLGMVQNGIDAIVRRGTSAERQRRVLTSGSGFAGVVDKVVRESMIDCD